MIKDTMNNQTPFPSPITLYRDTTSYNRPGSWIQESFKYIKFLTTKAHFPQLTAALDNRTSPLVIVNLAGDANLTSHTGGAVQDIDKLPPIKTTVHGAD